jgi:TetR/AcrR family transcriptional regulator, cholesterol catabolism regulator
MAGAGKQASKSARPRGASNSDDPSRRAEIMADAAEVFGRLGYAHATMRDVADATGILAGSLYHHFASKEELLFEIMHSFNEDILRDMHAVIEAEDDALVRIVNMIDLALRYITERRDEARIMTNDAHYIAASAALAPIAEGFRQAEALWIQLLRKGVASGVLRPDLDPRIAYGTLMGAIFSSLRWYRPGGGVRPRQFREHVSAQLLRGILNDT